MTQTKGKKHMGKKILENHADVYLFTARNCGKINKTQCAGLLTIPGHRIYALMLKTQQIMHAQEEGFISCVGFRISCGAGMAWISSVWGLLRSIFS